MIIIITC